MPFIKSKYSNEIRFCYDYAITCQFTSLKNADARRHRFSHIEKKREKYCSSASFDRDNAEVSAVFTRSNNTSNDGAVSQDNRSQGRS